jgi:hypothetical protein
MLGKGHIWRSDVLLSSLDWARFRQLGEEMHLFLQDVPEYQTGSDGRITDESQRQHKRIQKAMCLAVSWYNARQREYEALERITQQGEQEQIVQQPKEEPSARQLNKGQSTRRREKGSRKEASCQTDDQEESLQEQGLRIRLVHPMPTEMPPWEVDELRDEWREWLRLRREIKDMTETVIRASDPGWDAIYPAGEGRDQLYRNRRQLHERLDELLQIPRPRDMPGREEVVDWKTGLSLAEQGSNGVTKDEFEESMPWSAEVAYEQALQAAASRKAAYRAEANVTRSRMPFWAPRDEWPLWKWYEVGHKHVRVRPDELVDGPYWCPRWDWCKWRKDPKRGWVSRYQEGEYPFDMETTQVRKRERDPEDVEGETPKLEKRRKGLANGESSQSKAAWGFSAKGTSKEDPIILE